MTGGARPTRESTGRWVVWGGLNNYCQGGYYWWFPNTVTGRRDGVLGVPNSRIPVGSNRPSRHLYLVRTNPDEQQSPSRLSGSYSSMTSFPLSPYTLYRPDDERSPE